MASTAQLVATGIHLGRRCASRLVTNSSVQAGAFTNVASWKPSWPQRHDVLCRYFAKMPDDLLNKRLDGFQDHFVEARLCIEDVLDSAETTYFDDDAKAAQEAVDAAVAEFTSLLGDIEDTDQKNMVLRGNGLKVEQLKGELEMAIKGGHH